MGSSGFACSMAIAGQDIIFVKSGQPAGGEKRSSCRHERCWVAEDRMALWLRKKLRSGLACRRGHPWTEDDLPSLVRLRKGKHGVIAWYAPSVRIQIQPGLPSSTLAGVRAACNDSAVRPGWCPAQRPCVGGMRATGMPDSRVFSFFAEIYRNIDDGAHGWRCQLAASSIKAH